MLLILAIWLRRFANVAEAISGELDRIGPQPADDDEGCEQVRSVVTHFGSAWPSA